MTIAKRLGFAVLFLPMALMVAGCGSEPEPEVPEAPPPPPPPTPEEIASKIIADLGLEEPLPAAGSRLPRRVANEFKQKVQTAKTANSATTEGKRALQIVSQKLDDRIRALEQNDLWAHVLAHIEAQETLNPESTRWDDTKRIAVAELAKPQVDIVGFFYDGTRGVDAVILDFYLPMSGQTERKRVTVGEEFFGLTLVEIIGNNQGVQFEYAETGQTFDVLTDAASR